MIVMSLSFLVSEYLPFCKVSARFLKLAQLVWLDSISTNISVHVVFVWGSFGTYLLNGFFVELPKPHEFIGIIGIIDFPVVEKWCLIIWGLFVGRSIRVSKVVDPRA